MRVYGIKNCASVKKAKEFFDKNSINYEFIDINKNSIDSSKVEYWKNFISPFSMINTRSKKYKELDIKNKKLSDKKVIELLSKENLLLKRPIIEHGLNGEEKFTIGFDQNEYNSIFLK
ncbi:MAG: arsenate reductase family protein [Halarcobacter sp.]